MFVISCAFVSRREHIADELAVAEDRHTVGERLDLMHFVRDDNDRLAVVAHVAQYGEELVGLLRRENGGRLVKDENVRAAVENLYDLDRLLLGDGHIVDLLRGIHARSRICRRSRVIFARRLL